MKTVKFISQTNYMTDKFDIMMFTGIIYAHWNTHCYSKSDTHTESQSLQQ